MGVQRTQSRARRYIYWLYLNNDVYNMINNRETYMKWQNSNPKEEILIHEVISIPRYKVGCDTLEYNNNKYMFCCRPVI